MSLFAALFASCVAFFVALKSEFMNKAVEWVKKGMESLFSTQKSVRLERESRFNIISNHQYDLSWQYNKTIVDNFVGRRFQYYGAKDEEISIKKLKLEIEHPKISRNLIITGPGGIGKSTALKWLFVHSNVKERTSVYLYAEEYEDAETIKDVFQRIEADLVEYKKPCLVFFDGLDELSCVKGDSSEFDEFIAFIDQLSTQSKNPHRFIVSTRPEHFDFHAKVINRAGKTTLDNYSIYELQPLNRRESLKLCKGIKKLSALDKGSDYNAHFQDKWPKPKGEGENYLREREYTKLLRQYIWGTKEEDSLLRFPLLCRYAYSIIVEWNKQRHSEIKQKADTESNRIETALTAYIKWEFHDQPNKYSRNTKNPKVQRDWEKYKEKVFSFLTEIAGVMGETEWISRSQWRALKGRKKLQGNIALCVLQERDNKNKSGFVFEHSSFRDYFLARYFVKVSQREINKTERDALSSLLTYNDHFALMYVELLTRNGSKLAQQVCAYILDKASNKQGDARYNSLMSYAKGRWLFTYECNAKVPFTVEEYFMIFPCGQVEYAGNRWNRSVIEEVYSTGILEVETVERFEECKAEQIMKADAIRGIHVNLVRFANVTGFKHFTSSFKCFFETEVRTIEYYFRTTSEASLLSNILRLPKFEDMALAYRENRISVSELLHNPQIQSAIRLVNVREQLTIAAEDNAIDSFVHSISCFLGKEHNYWCLFDGSSMFAYEMHPLNEYKMNALFQERMSENPIDYSTSYGEYNLMAKPVSMQVKPYKTRDISFFFSAQDCITSKKEKPLNPNFSNYYDARWINVQLLKSLLQMEERGETYDSFMLDKASQIQRLHDAYDGYVYIDEISDTDSETEAASFSSADVPDDEEFQLPMSDQKLITHFILKEQDEILKLANETLQLCEQHQYFAGKKFREFLKSIDFSSDLSSYDINKVYMFAHNYIWM